MQSACPGRSFNAGLTGCTAVTLPSSLTLPHARLSLRHSSTLYDAHKPRLRLGRGKLGKHSSRLRQAQNYSGRRPSVPEKTVQPGHAAVSPTRHRDSASMHPDGQGRTTGRASCQALQLISTSPCAPPLVTIKGRGGQQLQRLDLHRIEHHLPGPGNEPPLPTSL
jgi:hypothetical protein